MERDMVRDNETRDGEVRMTKIGIRKAMKKRIAKKARVIRGKEGEKWREGKKRKTNDRSEERGRKHKEKKKKFIFFINFIFITLFITFFFCFLLLLLILNY